MGPLTRSIHDPLPKVIIAITLLSTLLSKHLHSTLLELARVSAFLLVISIEVLSVIQKWDPIFQLFSLACFFLFFIVKPLLSKPQSTFKSIGFMAKLLKSSGQGEQTHLSPALYYIPPITHLQESIKEVHMILFPVMEDLLSKTKLSPQDIDILIVNCTSLCSAGILGVHLAQNLLKVHKNSYAIVLSTEITSAGWYAGNDKSKLLSNCIFRMGVREEDSNGALGVTFSHDIVQVVSETVRSNITVLGSAILPLLEKFSFGLIIDIGKGLKLGERETEASLMTLRRFGNQSSSSSWYVLAYMEAKERVKKGDKVWQLGMGSGPKCVSFVWECMRPMVEESKKGPWADCIGEYPILLRMKTIDNGHDHDPPFGGGGGYIFLLRSGKI
ncbi:3-ketoacyl-CoA synthase 6 [Vitis vinifera]|uniref:very-long-chain 3-oxoacyl-CoA synthase n=1 Tax=Vitis vinifera TaxID=29760 RepID=A0A438I1S4_VITVI|nr:3-ketoacyl-CoA synthase 6 [Vitis vinifera]